MFFITRFIYLHKDLNKRQAHPHDRFHRCKKVARSGMNGLEDVFVFYPEIFFSLALLDLRDELVHDNHGDAVEKGGHVGSCALLSAVQLNESACCTSPERFGVVVHTCEDAEGFVCDLSVDFEAVGGVRNSSGCDGHSSAFGAKRVHHLLLAHVDDFFDKLGPYRGQEIKS